MPTAPIYRPPKLKSILIMAFPSECNGPTHGNALMKPFDELFSDKISTKK